MDPGAEQLNAPREPLEPEALPLKWHKSVLALVRDKIRLPPPNMGVLDLSCPEDSPEKSPGFLPGSFSFLLQSASFVHSSRSPRMSFLTRRKTRTVVFFPAHNTSSGSNLDKRGRFLESIPFQYLYTVHILFKIQQ